MPVSIGRCRRYDYPQVKAVLGGLLDQLGGIGSLVRGRTVTVKVNLTGNWNAAVYTLSPVETVYTHPVVALATLDLLQEAGARRLILCESLYSTADPRVTFQNCGYDVRSFESTVAGLLWEDTRHLGSGSSYRELPVPGGRIFSRLQFNHRYVDTDVVVSVAKMKNHEIAGITLAMKNMFGATPSSLYSSSIQDEYSTSARVDVLHEGAPSAAGGEVLPVPSLDRGVRVPNVIVDILAARPVDLCIVDGIVTMHGGEGAWQGTRLGLAFPGLLLAGRNPVCTDAVGAAVMGYDPDAAGWTVPFYNGLNTLRLAAERGLGTHRLEEIEVRGLSVQAARYDFQPTFKLR
jgi:uncharacterized protein (DUF362 family)